MKSKSRPAEPVREYRQVARAEAAEQREQKIVAAFIDLARTRWFDEFTLNDVAEAAGVTAQTVIRKFGGKEGLLKAAVSGLSEEITARRSVPDGDIDRTLTALVADYDVVGDFVMRFLNEEDRKPMLASFLAHGRAHHRAWAGEAFKPWLKPLAPKARRERLDLLVAATDLYLWRLFRRDMKHDSATTVALMRALVRGVLGPAAFSEGKSS